MKMSKKGNGKFIIGGIIGAAIALLFAPTKGSETRKALKIKFDELVASLKEIDVEEVRDSFETKIDEIKVELKDLDQEKVMTIAKEKAKIAKDKAEELLKLAKEKGTPILQDAAKSVLEKVIAVSDETIKNIKAQQK